MDQFLREIEMLGWRKSIPIALGLIMAALAAAQSPPAEKTAVCTYEDGREISVRFHDVSAAKDLRNGQLWPPAEQPIYLFTQVEITLGGSTLAPKAYRLYLVPGDDKWTLVVNQNVEEGAPYSKEEDIVRVPMDKGKLPKKELSFKMDLGHIAPRQCSLLVYYGATGAFATISEK